MALLPRGWLPHLERKTSKSLERGISIISRAGQPSTRAASARTQGGCPRGPSVRLRMEIAPHVPGPLLFLRPPGRRLLVARAGLLPLVRQLLVSATAAASWVGEVAMEVERPSPSGVRQPCAAEGGRSRQPLRQDVFLRRRRRLLQRCAAPGEPPLLAPRSAAKRSRYWASPRRCSRSSAACRAGELAVAAVGQGADRLASRPGSPPPVPAPPAAPGAPAPPRPPPSPSWRRSGPSGRRCRSRWERHAALGDQRESGAGGVGHLRPPFGLQVGQVRRGGEWSSAGDLLLGILPLSEDSLLLFLRLQAEGQLVGVGQPALAMARGALRLLVVGPRLVDLGAALAPAPHGMVTARGWLVVPTAS